MISRRIKWGTRSAFLAIVTMTSAAAVLSAQNTVVDVTDSRPLSAAIDALEVVVGTSINYEDPPYENATDLQDVSTQAQRTAQAGFRLLVPRVGRVTAGVPTPSAGIVQENDVIFDVNLLLANYRQNTLPGDFTVEQANGMLYVTPTQVLGANGSVRSVTSPMMSLVTIPYAQRSVSDTVQAIFDAVYKATGLRIVIGNLPFWPTDVVSFGASGVSARDALAQLFVQTRRGPLSYRLTFDPKPDTMRFFDYMINVQPTGFVVPAAPADLRPILGSPAPAAPPPPSAGRRPGFPEPKQ